MLQFLQSAALPVTRQQNTNDFTPAKVSHMEDQTGWHQLQYRLSTLGDGTCACNLGDGRPGDCLAQGPLIPSPDRLF